MMMPIEPPLLYCGSSGAHSILVAEIGFKIREGSNPMGFSFLASGFDIVRSPQTQLGLRGVCDDDAAP
jgi:hypothetical protein